MCIEETKNFQYNFYVHPQCRFTSPFFRQTGPDSEWQVYSKIECRLVGYASSPLKETITLDISIPGLFFKIARRAWKISNSLRVTMVSSLIQKLHGVNWKSSKLFEQF